MSDCESEKILSKMSKCEKVKISRSVHIVLCPNFGIG